MTVFKNNFTLDIISNFCLLFLEMAERHNVPQVLMKARDLVHKVQTLIENK